jgi:hypothetical protein
MRQLSKYIVAVVVAGALCLTPVAAEEQLQQDTISIKGNQALPKTLYIAPWKRVGGPLESGQIDGEIREESKPVERDIFQRQLQLQREGYSID